MSGDGSGTLLERSNEAAVAGLAISSSYAIGIVVGQPFEPAAHRHAILDRRRRSRPGSVRTLPYELRDRRV